MKSRRFLSCLLAALGLAVLILDTRTALQAGAQGVQLCLQTLIPSLFPFFMISNLLTSSLLGVRISFLERLLRLPQGTGSLFFVGLLGGYPVGAQAVGQASLPQEDSRRMLAFCSNAGPAFLFGIGARLFSNLWVCWLVWAIHIFSALIVGLLTPGKSRGSVQLPRKAAPTLPQNLKKSVETMALVCGWVILFRVLLGFFQRWFLWLLPPVGQVLCGGLLELANGCTQLTTLPWTGIKFSVFSVLLGFGGLCVLLQTHSVAGKADTSLYLPGKITQAAVSFLLSLPCQLLFQSAERLSISLAPVVLCLGLILFYPFICRKIQNRGRNLQAAIV